MTDQPHFCKCGCGKRIFKAYNSTIWPEYYLGHNPNKKEPEKRSIVAKKTIKKINQKSPKSRAMKTADNWFSKYIRLKFSQELMFGVFVCYCYTCGSRHGIKEIEAGHYISREHKQTRFDENNVRPQCNFCNCHRQGRHLEFGIKLAKEIGAEKIDDLKQMSLFPGEDNEIFYREKADIYRKKFNELVKEKGSNPWKNKE